MFSWIKNTTAELDLIAFLFLGSPECAGNVLSFACLVEWSGLRRKSL